jgi:hypothetical protein
MALARESGAQSGLFHERQKSCDTVSLIVGNNRFEYYIFGKTFTEDLGFATAILKK